MSEKMPNAEAALIPAVLKDEKNKVHDPTVPFQPFFLN